MLRAIACIVLMGAFCLSRSFGQPAAPPEPPREEPARARGYRLPPEKYEKAVAYARARYILYFAGFAYGLAALLLLLALRAGPRYRSIAERISKRHIVQALIFTPLLVATLEVLELPLAAYRHTLAVKYGQSIQGWPSWFGDWGKQLALGALAATVVVWLLYAVIRSSPRRWWFYFWLASLPLIVFVVFISPYLIDPLFYRFRPLAPGHPELAGRLRDVTARAGLAIPEDRMFIMDASEKVTSVNAYVTGIGASKRVVVWDTTLDKLTTEETAFVYAHELGHYVLSHVPLGITFAAGLTLVFFYLGFHMVNGLIRMRGERWGFRGPGDLASLPALLVVFTVAGFASDPIANAFSRMLERRADTFALEAAHGLIPEAPEVAARSFQRLGEINLSDPAPSDPIVFWLFSHPPVDERIAYARNYRPWETGEPLRYFEPASR